MTTTFPKPAFPKRQIDPQALAALQENVRELARDGVRGGFWLVIAAGTLWWMMSLIAGWNSGLL